MRNTDRGQKSWFFPIGMAAGFFMTTVIIYLASVFLFTNFPTLLVDMLR